MAQDKRIRFNEKDYVWTGRGWYEARTFLIPPEVIIRQLNAQLQEELESEDTAIVNSVTLTERASAARDTLQFARAETLVRRALTVAPGDQAALAVLCSILRVRGRPQQALDETDAFKRVSHPPLLTSRAAALCDLKKWEDAKKEIGRALAIQESEEAFNVVRRIKAVRPDLYS
jgi:tetratricopeptide (TPR) repeat protein